MKKAFYLLMAAGLPIFAGAQSTDTGRLPKNVDDVTTLITGWVTYLIGLFWVAAFLSGLYAAFKYLTAKGDPKKAAEAQQMVIYTVIAACVALLSTVIKEIAKSFLEI